MIKTEYASIKRMAKFTYEGLLSLIHFSIPRDKIFNDRTVLETYKVVGSNNTQGLSYFISYKFKSPLNSILSQFIFFVIAI